MIINKLSAVTIIQNHNNEILLGRRTDNNTWSLPGGKLEPNETYLEAAKRELFEEVGLFVNTITELGFSSVHSNKNQFWQSMIYWSDSFYGNNNEDEWGIKLNHEMKEYKWFTIDEIQELINSNQLFVGTKAVFEKYLDNIKESW